ncbi:MAG: indolepyruvate/phenylpyruvate decarboxylase [Kordiimonadaceae bacterium]|nr:indolepyruvate/phenylpyruvate decarboxylase [Kordiimonadaceae bacterium]
MNLAQSLLHALKNHGAKEIFGIPGDFILPFFKVMEESKILPFYTLSHEPAVGFAADAAGRENSTLGVVAVTYGAGAFNVLNAATGAYAEKSPLVIISGGPGLQESRLGLLLHHKAKTLDSQLKIFSEITCDQAVLNNPKTAHKQIAQVLRSCKEHSRPVYIEIPRDLTFDHCEEVMPAPASPVDANAVSACADEIFKRLEAAEKPVVMAGVEIRRFNLEKKLSRLAQKLCMPVATTFMGRGLLTEEEDPLIGTYMGLSGCKKVKEAVESSDALLMLGVIFADTNFGVSKSRINLTTSITAADRTVNLGYHSYHEIPLEHLIDALLKRADKNVAPNIQKPCVPKGGLIADNAKIVPHDIAKAVNDLFEVHGKMKIVSDVGDCLFTTVSIQPTSLTGPAYYAGMGFGVPAGMGVQATTGERPLILVGDGAFQMTGWELGNCRRYGWDPLVIVFNNCSWEMLRTFQPDVGFNDLDDWKFAALATILGGDGYRVQTRAELKDALDKAYATRGKFQLVEVMMDRKAISPTLKRFTDAIKAAKIV